MASKRKSGANKVSTSKKQKVKPSSDEYNKFYSSTLKYINSLQSDEDGRELVSPFLKLPNKKLYPDYYSVILNPMTVGEVQRKLSKGKYSDQSTEEFLSDFKLVYDNAAIYNDPESWIVKDAKQIYEIVKEKTEKFESGEGVSVGDDEEEEEEEVPKDTSKSKSKAKKVVKEVAEEDGDEITYANLGSICSNLLQEVINHEFPELGIISDPFMNDVDAKEYPEYYKIIQKPTSFNSVLNKIQKKRLFSSKISILENLQRFHDETVLIFKNAQTYNDPSSLIHQDSENLEEVFSTKYEEVKKKVENEQDNKGKLKLKIKNPSKKASGTGKVKLNLKLKDTEEVEKPKSKKSRKKAKIEPTEKDVDISKDEILDSNDIDNESNNDENEKSELHSDEDIENDEDLDDADEKDSKSFASDSYVAPNHMGKSDISLSPKDNVIQEVVVSSSTSTINMVTNQMNQRVQKLLDFDKDGRRQEINNQLFPAHSNVSLTSFFEYRFPANGYVSQSYTVALPPESPPIVTVKVPLNQLLYKYKKNELLNSQGYSIVSSDEEFQCKLLVNEDEISSGDIFEEKKENANVIVVQYETKLSHGLNILTFECKLAPSLTKKIKKNLVMVENEDPAGRHTRHQLQQLKANWDVETFNLNIICNSP